MDFKIMRFLKAWLRGIPMNIESMMTYKLGFFLVVLSLFFGDVLIPIVSTLIYSVSNGIPGWTLWEFVFFQGTLILVMGVWHTLFVGVLGETISLVQEGSFDKVLLRPINSLAYLTANAFDPEGIAEVIAGLGIVAFALFKLQKFDILILAYLGILVFATIFEFSLTIICSAMAFLFTKTWRLFEFMSLIETYSRYPLDIFSTNLKFVLTFIIPAAVASYYPAAIFLGKQDLGVMWKIAVPIAAFFIFSLLLWDFAIRRYNSAGG